MQRRNEEKEFDVNSILNIIAFLTSTSDYCNSHDSFQYTIQRQVDKHTKYFENTVYFSEPALLMAVFGIDDKKT